MAGWTDDWMHGWMKMCVGCLLVVAWDYGRLSHARGPLPIGLRVLRHARGPAGLLLTNNQHTFNQPYIQSSNHPSNHPSIRSSTHPLPNHTLLHTSIHPPIQSSTHPFIHQSIRTSIHPTIYPHTHPSHPS